MAANRCLGLILLIAVGVLAFSSNEVSAQGPQGCDIQGLINKCANYVLRIVPKSPPSPDCCAVVKSVDIPCVCQHLTPEIETLVDVEKVIYVAKTCGRPIPPGTKCGAYTVPPTPAF